MQWTEADVLVAAKAVMLAPVAGGFEPRLGGAAIDDELRSAAVTSAVSRVAKMPGVRAWVNNLVRTTAAKHNSVVDGRDMGTAVFPKARLKVYLTADSWERARRRLIQRGGGAPKDDDVAEEMAAIIARDARDAEQSGQAPDAVLIDTSALTQEQQVAQIVSLARLAQAR
jgi:cytidylate kinase